MHCQTLPRLKLSFNHSLDYRLTEKQVFVFSLSSFFLLQIFALAERLEHSRLLGFRPVYYYIVHRFSTSFDPPVNGSRFSSRDYTLPAIRRFDEKKTQSWAATRLGISKNGKNPQGRMFNRNIGSLPTHRVYCTSRAAVEGVGMTAHPKESHFE